MLGLRVYRLRLGLIYLLCVVSPFHRGQGLGKKNGGYIVPVRTLFFYVPG